MTSLTEGLSQFIVGLTYERIPSDLVPRVCNGFTDYAAVTMLSRNDEVTRILRQTVVPHAGLSGEARLCFTAARAGAADAALVSGTASHAQDYDDVGLVGIQPTHPSAAIAPAIFAEAEALGRNGRDMLCAYVAAFEVWGDLAARHKDAVHMKGWHPTGTFGSIAAAAACAYLRRLDVAQTAHALGLAATMASGFIANFGSMAKPFHAGRAAQNGVLAGRLAEAGMTASADALESPVGFMKVIAPKGDVDLESPVRFGEHWYLASHGLGFKLFPMCYGAHRALDGIFALLKEHPFTAGEVDRIEVHATRLQYANLVHTDPRTGLDAKFSMEFAMAAPILTGRVTRAEFTDDFVQQPQVRDLLQRVHRVYLDEPPKGEKPRDCIRLFLKHGAQREQVLRVPMGHADRPPSTEALWMKFADCVEGALPAGEARAMFDKLQTLPHLATLADLPVSRD